MRGTKELVARTRGFTRRLQVVLALVASAAVDSILIALALGWGRGRPQAAGPTPSSRSATSVGDHRADAGDEVATTSTRSGSFSSVRTAPRLLTAASETVAWRSEGGACDEPGSLELTVDGGETWGAAQPTAGGFGRPLWSSGTDHTAVQSAAGSGGECQPDGLRTFDSGSSWTEDYEVITNSVLVDPSDRSRVIWAGESIQGPSHEMTQVAVTGGEASVVCGNGTLWSVHSDRTGWIQTGLESPVAVSGSERRWVAAVGSASCGGVAVEGFENASVEPIACISGDPEDAIALDLFGNTLWVWVGDQVLVLADVGRSLNS